MKEINQALKPLVSSRLSLFRPGDVLNLVYEERGGHWKVRKFTGICISYCRGVTPRCILRNVFNGIAIELSFDVCSKTVISLSSSSRYKKIKLSRAKLYYLRGKRLMESKI